MSRRLPSWRDLNQRKPPTKFRMLHSHLAAGQNLMRLNRGTARCLLKIWIGILVANQVAQNG
jgi:hypothetical protein